MRDLSSVLCLASILALSACVEQTEEPSVPEWLGEQEHLRIVGTLDGEELDIGEGGSLEVEDFFCRREYLAPEIDGVLDESQAAFTELKIYATVANASGTRYLTLEFKRHDLQSSVIGAEVEVVPRLETVEPGPDQMWVEYEWNDAEGTELLESAAQAGVFTLELFSGSPAPGSAVIPADEGMVGGHLSARWSPTEALELSFSAPCREIKVEAEA